MLLKDEFAVTVLLGVLLKSVSTGCFTRECEKNLHGSVVNSHQGSRVSLGELTLASHTGNGRERRGNLQSAPFLLLAKVASLAIQICRGHDYSRAT